MIDWLIDWLIDSTAEQSLHWQVCIDKLSVGDSTIKPVSAARNLGTFW